MSRLSDWIDYLETLPDWYWKSGLHDAAVVGVETFEFPFDYDKFVGQKSKYDRNLMILRLDASGAYDNRVKEIHFYNYKILSDVSIENRDKIWWMSDELSVENDHYVLTISMQDLDSWPEDILFKIKFDRAEVKR